MPIKRSTRGVSWHILDSFSCQHFLLSIYKKLYEKENAFKEWYEGETRCEIVWNSGCGTNAESNHMLFMNSPWHIFEEMAFDYLKYKHKSSRS